MIVVFNLMQPVVLSLLILAPFYLVVRQFMEPNYFRLGLLGILQCLYFAPLAYFIVLRRNERALFSAAFKRSPRNSDASS